MRNEDKPVSDLNMELVGNPAGPALLLVHPMGADRAFWDECLPFWSDRFCCIRVDLRGAGGSPRADAPLTIERLAADLDAVCRDAGVESVVPVGCAIGAFVAVAYARRRPDACEALVLSNPGFRTLPQARAALEARMQAVRDAGMSGALPGAIESAFAEGPDDPRRVRYQERFAAQDPLSYAFQIEGMLHADISDALGSIDCPVLIVGGGKDRLLPVEDHALPVRERLLDGEYVLFESGAHFIPYQMPEEFAGLVLRFLDRKLRPEARPDSA